MIGGVSIGLTPDSFREDLHQVRIAGAECLVRSLVAGDWGSRAAQHHVLISGYTLSAETFVPFAMALLERGAAVRLVDPFTLLGVDAALAGRLALSAPQAFGPRAYASRLAGVIAGPDVATTVWAESFGAHVALCALVAGDISPERVVLMSPNGLRQNVGPTAVHGAISRVIASPRIISGLCRIPTSRVVRKLVYGLARNLVGELRYDTPHLRACREFITEDRGRFCSAMILPLLGINQELLDPAALQVSLAGRTVTLVQPSNDRMLRHEMGEDGRALRQYREAWTEVAHAICAHEIDVNGGHEAVFEPGFDAEALVDAVI